MAGEQGEQSPSTMGTGRKSEIKKHALNRALVNYLIAIAAPVVGLVWRLAMVRHFGDLPTYITFYPAVMLVAIVAGLGPGLVATAVSALLTDYWVLPPRGFGIANAADVVALVLFTLLGIFISVVAERYRRIRQRAAEYEKKLALRASEERYRALVELSPAAIWLHRGGRIEFANPAACALFGASDPEQLYGKSPFDLLHPDCHAALKERIESVLEGNRAPLLEGKIVRLDGTVRDVEVVASPFTDERGPAVQAILRDITERKQREEQLRKLYRTLKALNNSNQALLHATDEAALLQKVCKIITEDCGHAMVWIGFAENDEGKTVRPVAYAGFEEGYLEGLGITWADTERGRGPTGTAIRTGLPSACQNMLTDPKFEPWRAQALKRGYSSSLVVPLMANCEAFGAVTIYSREPETFSDDEINLLVELAGDLSHGISALRMRTANEQAQKEINQSQEWLRVTLTSIGDAVITSDAHGSVTFLNPVAEALTGWQMQDALGQPIQSVFRIINEQTGEPAADIVSQVLRERRIVSLANHTALVTKDGKRTPIEDSAAPITDAAGNISGVVLVFHDVTERRAAQEELRLNEERLRFHFENTPLAVVEWGPDFRLSKWSGEAERIFGWRAEEVLGKRLDEFKWVHEEDVAKVAEISAGLLDGSRARSVSPNRNYRKDGSVVHCEWYNSSLLDASGKLLSIASLVLDVTDRKQAEEALIRGEKLAAVGRMAASIAHEINNPLSAVMNALYLAQISPDMPPQVRGYLEIADEELKRVSHITRQTLGFYRESSVPAEVSVSAILDSAVDLLQSRIKAKGAKVERQYKKDLRITAVGGELRQVFSNLLLNSLEAVGENGVIKLRAAKSRFKGNGEPAVRITVADNGKGIDAALRSRVFEPLFTTKDVTGTGLGLWVTRQIVEKHGGSIRFRSRTKGQATGTVFSVVIPATHESLSAREARAASSS
jgi:PAS domain S-box-containing protein